MTWIAPGAFLMGSEDFYPEEGPVRRVEVAGFWIDTQPVTVRDAGVQTILIRALQWLAKRPVTYPVPPDFPTETATSVRGDLPLPAN